MTLYRFEYICYVEDLKRSRSTVEVDQMVVLGDNAINLNQTSASLEVLDRMDWLANYVF